MCWLCDIDVYARPQSQHLSIVMSEEVESVRNWFTCKLHTNGLSQWCYPTEYAYQEWRQCGHQWYVNHCCENCAFFGPEKYNMLAITNTIFISPHTGRSVSRLSLSRSYASAWSSMSPAFSSVLSTSSLSTQALLSACLVFGTSFGFCFLVLAELAFLPTLCFEPVLAGSP